MSKLFTNIFVEFSRAVAFSEAFETILFQKTLLGLGAMLIYYKTISHSKHQFILVLFKI